MEWITPKVVELVLTFAEKGGLAFGLLILLIWLVVELRRGKDKDKIIAAKDRENAVFQAKMLELIGEMKTAASNANLLLEMLTRGRR